MKKSKRITKILLCLMMAALLCVSALTMAGAAGGQTAAKLISYDNYFTGWSQVYCYAWNSAGEKSAWPGDLMTETPGSSRWQIQFDPAYDHVVFSNGQGAQTVDLAIPEHESMTIFFADGYTGGKIDGSWKYTWNYRIYLFYPKDYWDNSDCYISFWGNGVPEQRWPGVKMQKDFFPGAYTATIMNDLQTVIINNGGNGKQTTVIVNPMTNNMYLDGSIAGYDAYGNAMYNVFFNEPYPH